MRTTALVILCLCLSFTLLWAGWQWKLTNEQLRSAINEAQWLVADARPEVRETLKQIKLGSFETRREWKALLEDLNGPQQQRARLSTMRAGESVAALTARIEQDTLPILNQSLRRSDEAIDAAKVLLQSTDTSLNGSLLPEVTKLLTSLRGTSDAFGVDGRAILAEVLVLTKQGETSLEAVNKVLASPEWLSILKSVDGSARNIELTTAQLPATAASVEKILKTSAQWQKPVLLAGLLATIARAFIP